MSLKILVIDDEPDALELARINLSGAGYTVITSADGADGLEQARQLLPELIILDLMLPGVEGLEVCKILRREEATKDIPIIMVTARATELDRVVGLEVGADDYLTKPFSQRELVLRVKALLRRRQTGEEAVDMVRVGLLVLDIPRHEVRVQNRLVELTATEFNLLVMLATKRGRVLSREQLLRDVWHYDAAIDSRTVDTHMRRLREKLGPASKYLDTVRRVGYRFVEE